MMVTIVLKVSCADNAFLYRKLHMRFPIFVFVGPLAILGRSYWFVNDAIDQEYRDKLLLIPNDGSAKESFSWK